jgi:hypothetical protein
VKEKRDQRALTAGWISSCVLSGTKSGCQNVNGAGAWQEIGSRLDGISAMPSRFSGGHDIDSANFPHHDWLRLTATSIGLPLSLAPKYGNVSKMQVCRRC